MTPLEPEEQVRATRSGLVRSLVSVTLAVLGLGYVFGRVDWHAFVGALVAINFPSFLALMGLFSVLVLVADSVAIRQVLSWNVGRVSLRDVIILRGASYLPSIVNYHLGQAWLAWVVSRAHRAPVWRIAGVTLLNYAGMFASVFVLGGISFALAPGAFPWLGSVLLTVLVLALAYFAVLHFAGPWLAGMAPTRVLTEAGIAGHLAALAVRAPHMVLLFLGSWFPFAFFGVSVPLGDALCLIPILVLVAALPLTPQGVGTREVVAVELLSRYASGSSEAERAAAVTACCLSWVITATLFEGILSLSCAPMARRLIARQDAA